MRVCGGTSQLRRISALFREIVLPRYFFPVHLWFYILLGSHFITQRDTLDDMFRRKNIRKVGRTNFFSHVTAGFIL